MRYAVVIAYRNRRSVRSRAKWVDPVRRFTHISILWKNRSTRKALWFLPDWGSYRPHLSNGLKRTQSLPAADSVQAGGYTNVCKRLAIKALIEQCAALHPARESRCSGAASQTPVCRWFLQRQRPAGSIGVMCSSWLIDVNHLKWRRIRMGKRSLFLAERLPI